MKKIKNYIKDEFEEFNIYDVYWAYSGGVISLYIYLFPKENIKSSVIRVFYNSWIFARKVSEFKNYVAFN